MFSWDKVAPSSINPKAWPLRWPVISRREGCTTLIILKTNQNCGQVQLNVENHSRVLHCEKLKMMNLSSHSFCVDIRNLLIIILHTCNFPTIMLFQSFCWVASLLSYLSPLYVFGWIQSKRQITKIKTKRSNSETKICRKNM